MANVPSPTGTDALLQQKRGLGQLPGLSGPATEAVLRVPLDSLDPNPAQPRKHFDEEQLADLAANIREIGQLEPIIVEQNSEQKGRWFIIAGERRVRALRLNGATTVKALERAGVTDSERRSIALAENLCRANLALIEEADGVLGLIASDPHTFEPAGRLDLEKLARRSGYSPSKLERLLAIARAPEAIRQALTVGVSVRRIDEDGQAVVLRTEPDGTVVYKQVTRVLEDQAHALALLPLARHLEKTKPKIWKKLLEKHIAVVLEEGWGKKGIDNYVKRLRDGAGPKDEPAGEGKAPTISRSFVPKLREQMRLALQSGELASLKDGDREELKSELRSLLQQLG